MTAPSARPEPAPRRRARRALRRGAWIVAGTVGVAVVLLGVALGVRPIREAVLRGAIAAARDAVPGELRVERAAWPALLRWELAGIGWTREGRDLAVVDSLVAAIDGGALRRRDAVVHELTLVARTLDVGAIAAAFPGPGGADGGADRGGPPAGLGVPWFRAGSVPGLPSAALESVHVRADTVRLPGGRILADVRVEAAADVRPDGPPSARLEAGVVDPAGVGRLEVAMETTGPGRATVVVRLPGTAVGPADAPLLRLDLTTGGTDASALRVAATGRLAVPGPRALARIPVLADALAEAPDRAGLDVRVDADADLGARAAALRLEASPGPWADEGVLDARWDGTAVRLDSLVVAARGVRARLRGDGDADSVRIALEATGAGHAVGVAAAARPAERPLPVRLAPIVVRVGDAVEMPALPSAPTIRVDPEAARAVVDGALLAGDYGDLRAKGTIGARDSIAVDVAWAPGPLPAGLARLLPDPATVDAVRARWPRTPEPGLQARAVVDLRDAARPWRVDGGLALPGPATFAPLLPPDARVDDLGPVRGRFEASGRAGAVPPTLDGSVDLARTDWIDVTRVEVHRAGDSLAVASRGGILDALDWDGRADRDAAGAWDAAARLVVDLAPLLARAVPARAAGAEAALTVDASFRGTPAAPDLEARATGRALVSGWELPSLEAEARWTPAGGSARIDLPEGVRGPSLSLDRARLAVEGDDPRRPDRPLRVEAEATGADASARIRGEVTRAAGWDAVADVVRVEWRGRDLAATGPVRVAWADSTLRIDALELAGSLGGISADGRLAPGDRDLRAELRLRIPEPPAELAIPPDLWPGDVRARATLTGADRIDAEATLADLRLDGLPAEATITIAADADTVAARVELRDEDRTRARASARLPRPRPGEPADSLRSRPLALRAEAIALPVPALWRGAAAPPRTFTLDGRLDLEGTLGAPDLRGDLRATFPAWPGLEDWAVAASAGLDPPDSAAAPGADGTSRRTARARWSLERRGTPLLEGTARLPLAIRPGPTPVVPDSTRDLALRIDSHPVPLAELDELLPPDLSLDGTVTIDLDVQGRLPDPGLAGRIGVDALKVSLEDGSRVTAGGAVELAGSLAKPEATGRLEVARGTIVVPDPPPALHPAEGDAMLWTAAPDSANGAAPPPPPAGPAAAADLDVVVDIPGGLWVLGKGIELELQGSLRLVQRAGVPSVSGTLSVRRGGFEFLGRQFAVERGAVEFGGDEEIDPRFDVVLRAEVGTYVVRIILGGTASKPKLSLESEPFLEEADITSLLVFGRTLDEIDDDQMGLVRERSGEVARAFGFSAVEDELRRRAGVDLLSLKAGEDGDATPSAVVVGKYLRPDVLLRFEQSLREQSEFLVNLEYLLTRRLKIETIYGRRAASGVEVNWSRDY